MVDLLVPSRSNPLFKKQFWKSALFQNKSSHHDAVGLVEAPQVHPAVLSARGQQAAGALPQSQAGNGPGVGLELL